VPAGLHLQLFLGLPKSFALLELLVANSDSSPD
jgi:hypothetical protein